MTKQKTKRKRGRPTKLDSELTEHFCTLLAQGNYAATVAASLGVGESTYYRWLQRGEDDSVAEKESQYRDFWESIKKATAQAETKVVENLSVHMEKNWQCCMTFLERRFPDRWSRGERRDVSMKAVAVSASSAKGMQDFSRLDDDELNLLMTLAAKLEGVDDPSPAEEIADSALRFYQHQLELVRPKINGPKRTGTRH